MNSSVSDSEPDSISSSHSELLEGSNDRGVKENLQKDFSSENIRRRPTKGKRNEAETAEVVVNSRLSHFSMTPATLAHKKVKESPLSSGAIFKQSHAGLFNLCLVLLLAVNSRLIVENLMKYGFLMRATFWVSSHSIHDWPLFMCGLSLIVFPLLSLLVETMKSRGVIPHSVSVISNVIILTVEILYPSYIIHVVNSAPLGGFILMFLTVILWMKLISYAHSNHIYSQLLTKDEKPETPEGTSPVNYPQNVTLKNMLYFLAAPTLCYQLEYPKSDSFRRGWFIRQIVKLGFFLGLMLFIIEQYINPTIQNSVHPLKGHFLSSIERVLKLSIPTVYVWLTMFYCFFHLWLNIVAEILHFGDREFYKDWWNAKTIEEYWRRWNMPVHKWMLRHVYFPCIHFGFSRISAMLIVFLISAIFHEVIVGIPCHMFRMWAFLGIAFQVPLVGLTNFLHEKFNQPMLGNMLFWFFFCIVGQPMCILLYYHDVQVMKQFN